MTDLAEQLERASRRVGVNRAELARMLATDRRTVSRWLSRETSPRGAAQQRVLELLAVLEHLSGVLRSEAAHDWLFMPNASLEHHKPADLLRAGESRAVIGAIDAMAEGVVA